MISLWDTDGEAVMQALAAERRSAGGVASGLALSLVVVVDEKRIRDAEAAATIAAAAHPCRIIIVARYDVKLEQSRLDAEIVVGGRLGPCEAVVMRMRGRLALHAESVVMPLLAPDVPVVTWWHMAPPERIAHDPLGVVADRRITDANQSAEPVEALRTRADDYAPGDTDLAWTRTTPWRTLIAGAFDAFHSPVTAITVAAPEDDPTAALLAGWLRARLGVVPTWEATEHAGRRPGHARRRRRGATPGPARRHGDPQARPPARPHAAPGRPGARRRTGRGVAPARPGPAVRGGARRGNRPAPPRRAATGAGARVARPRAGREAGGGVFSVSEVGTRRD